ncbi:Prevent-host-death family protein [Acidobacteriia bacterium SbA2]|nr:Prevent-host-death family protein [Acidobacteriia bacterium SbA2]
MSTVGLFEAKTHFSALIARVVQGEVITITKHGVPVAVLTPAANRRRRDPKMVAQRIRAMRQGARLEGVTIRQLIDDGRG